MKKVNQTSIPDRINDIIALQIHFKVSVYIFSSLTLCSGKN